MGGSGSRTWSNGAHRQGNCVVGEHGTWRRTVNEHEQRLIASISKSMAMMCVRNTMLEDIHAGIEPVSRAGDFTDIMVIDANGRRIPWPEVSRIGNEEMGRLMRQVVNRIYTFQAKADDLHFVAMMDRALAEAWRWDEPELDEIILSAIASSRRRAEEGEREWGSRRMSGETEQASPYTLSISRRSGIGQRSLLRRRRRSRKGRSCGRAATDSDAQPFETARFRNAFASGILHSSGMGARRVKDKGDQGFERFPTEINAGQTTYIARSMRKGLRITGARPKRLRRKMDRLCWHTPRSCGGPMAARGIGVAEASRKTAACFASCAGAARTGMVAGSGVPPGPAGTQGVEGSQEWGGLKADRFATNGVKLRSNLAAVAGQSGSGRTGMEVNLAAIMARLQLYGRCPIQSGHWT